MTEEVKKEYVYFVLYNHGVDQFVKVGKSNNEKGVMSRFSSIQTGSPKELNLLGYIEGSESEWHQMLRGYQARGEWFYYYRIRNILSALDLRVPQKMLESFRKKRIEETEKLLNNTDHEGTQDCYKSTIKEIKNLENKKLIRDYREGVLESSYHQDPCDYGRYGRDREYEEAKNNMNNIQKVLNFIHHGNDGFVWGGGGDIQITECKRSTLDIFNCPINQGEIYFRTGDYGIGYSLVTGYRLYNIFIEFMRSRKRRTRISAVHPSHGRPIEKESLKALCDHIVEGIKEDLGIKFFDYNVTTWRDKEDEQSFDYITKYSKQIKQLKKEGKYDERWCKTKKDL